MIVISVAQVTKLQSSNCLRFTHTNRLSVKHSRVVGPPRCGNARWESGILWVCREDVRHDLTDTINIKLQTQIAIALIDFGKNMSDEYLPQIAHMVDTGHRFTVFNRACKQKTQTAEIFG